MNSMIQYVHFKFNILIQIQNNGIQIQFLLAQKLLHIPRGEGIPAVARLCVLYDLKEYFGILARGPLSTSRVR